MIAIENARLFEEVQARTTEATESLEYQTATSEVLGVISRSPTDVQPVFDTIASNAARLCGAHMGAVFRFDGELLHLVAPSRRPAGGARGAAADASEAAAAGPGLGGPSCREP